MSTIADLPNGWTRIPQSTRVRWVRGGGLEAEATWYGPWSTYAAFLKAVGGLEQEIEYPGGGTVTRVVPLKFPSDSPDFENCYAVDAELEGTGFPAEHPTEGITYTHARARVYFRSEAFYAFGEDRPMLTYSSSSGLDFITRPGTAYEMPSDDLRLNQDVGVPVAWRDFQITLYGLTESADDLYDALLGKLNSVDFEAPNGQTYPPGTVLYFGPATNYTRTIGNVKSWVVSHRLKYREVPHDEIMRPDGGGPDPSGFEAPVIVGTTTKMLQREDLMQLYTNALA